MDRFFTRHKSVMKRWAVAIFAVVVLIAPARAHAERITGFTSDVTVQSSGRVDVTETIGYDFEDAVRHGIYRYIPISNEDDQGNEYRPNVTVDSVAVDNQPVKYEVGSSNGNKVIKIGDPDITIGGTHDYTIRYHFDSLVVGKDGDLLRYNVLGTGWQVPIASAVVQVHGPAPFKTVCYTGDIGSKEHNCDIAGLGTQTVNVKADNLGDGKDLTIEALWPQGTITNLLPPYQEPWWLTALYIAGFVYVAAGVLVFLAACVRWLGIRYAEKRAERDQTIVAQYEPPKNLTAGEIGLLADNNLSMVEVTATLIEAAVAGYIRIEQTSAKSMFKKAEYKLIKLKAFDGMDAGEKDLLTTIFDGKTEMALQDIDRTAVPAAIGRYQKAVREKAKQMGFYTARSKFLTAGAMAAVFVVLFIVAIPAFVIVAALILPLSLWMYCRVGQTPRRTPDGLKVWAYVQGFKLFLSVTEKDRLAFTDAPERTPKQFSKLLPYAIALGVEEQWAKQFEGIDITKSTGWYTGYDNRAFTAGYLAGSLHDSFASSVAVASKTPTQSSSGGFGGGFSGGGFGGGGGGSW